MNDKQLATFAKIQAMLITVEGMKARNALSLYCGEHPFWNQQEFEYYSEELLKLAKELENDQPEQ